MTDTTAIATAKKELTDLLNQQNFAEARPDFINWANRWRTSLIYAMDELKPIIASSPWPWSMRATKWDGTADLIHIPEPTEPPSITDGAQLSDDWVLERAKGECFSKKQLLLELVRRRWQVPIGLVRFVVKEEKKYFITSRGTVRSAQAIRNLPILDLEPGLYPTVPDPKGWWVEDGIGLWYPAHLFEPYHRLREPGQCYLGGNVDSMFRPEANHLLLPSGQIIGLDPGVVQRLEDIRSYGFIKPETAYRVAAHLVREEGGWRLADDKAAQPAVLCTWTDSVRRQLRWKDKPLSEPGPWWRPIGVVTETYKAEVIYCLDEVNRGGKGATRRVNGMAVLYEGGWVRLANGEVLRFEDYFRP